MTGFTGDQLMAAIPALSRYATKLCKGSGAERHQDLLQGALLRAWEKRELFRVGDQHALTRWVINIMHNLFISGARRDKKFRNYKNMLAFQGNHFLPSEHAETLILARDIERELNNLLPRQRELIRRIVIDGQSYDAAAEDMDIPVGTVRSALSRGRQAFREAFAK